jgi:ElaB/YqjD/DUF883 family membrane-anchored ribosome-binding protein
MSTQSQKLAADVRILVNDAEELIRATAAETGDKMVELRRRMQQAVNDIRPQMASIESAVTEKVTSAASCTDAYVRDNPWTSIGISAGIGVVVGLLIGRR